MIIDVITQSDVNFETKRLQFRSKVLQMVGIQMTVLAELSGVNNEINVSTLCSVCRDFSPDIISWSEFIDFLMDDDRFEVVQDDEQSVNFRLNWAEAAVQQIQA